MTRTPYLRAWSILSETTSIKHRASSGTSRLFLFGLIALGWMIRVRHRLTIPWLLLYGSLMAPPALLAEWGGIPLGRLNWGGMWLWLLPIGWWMGAERTSLSRYIRPVLLAALAYQAILAFRWIPSPTDLLLGFVLEPGLGARFTVPAPGPLHLPPLLSQRWRRMVGCALSGVPAEPDLGDGSRAARRDRMDVERRRDGGACGRSGSAASPSPRCCCRSSRPPTRSRPRTTVSMILWCDRSRARSRGASRRNG